MIFLSLTVGKSWQFTLSPRLSPEPASRGHTNLREADFWLLCVLICGSLDKTSLVPPEARGR